MSINAPENFPGYEWVSMTKGSEMPEHATYYPGEPLNGLEVRIGRVYDQNSLYVGSAIPEIGICKYITKDLEVKSSSNYEIISVDHYPRVNFRDIELENSNLKAIFEVETPTFFDWDFPSDMRYWNIMVPAGLSDKGEVLGVARCIDGVNVYYGWVNPSSKKAYIPREAQQGPQVLSKNFSTMLRGGIPRMMLFKC